jgi:HEPN domain-containing protein
MPEEVRLRKIANLPFTCDPKTFWRAATQRLETATFLLESGSRKHWDAVYLAGYVAECVLKALILKRTPKRKRRAVREELTSGAKSHNFDFLRVILSRSGSSFPKTIREELDDLQDEWSSDLRYVVARISYRETERFIKHVRSIYDWVERSL